MLHELQELKWYQKDDGLVINLPLSDGRTINFPVERNMINFLVSQVPKLFILNIEIENKETLYLLDLEGLRSVVSHEYSLKIRVGQKIEKNVSHGCKVYGKYYIMRGESYQDRCITDKGWSRQKKYFDIIDVNELEAKAGQTVVKETIKKEAEKPVEPKKEVQKEKPRERKVYGKLAECINCNEIIPADLQACPYCNAVQFGDTTAGGNSPADDDIMDISI